MDLGGSCGNKLFIFGSNGDSQQLKSPDDLKYTSRWEFRLPALPKHIIAIYSSRIHGLERFFFPVLVHSVVEAVEISKAK